MSIEVVDGPLEDEPVMTATVETLGIGHQGKQTYALYNVRVSRCVNGREVSSWNVIRRYSDFHTLHQVLVQKVRKMMEEAPRKWRSGRMRSWAAFF